MEQLFQKFEKSAYRIEILPEYNIDMECKEYIDFLNGNPIEFGDQDWIDNLKKWKSQNKIIKRIRVISEELNTYQKYEFFCYEQNYLAGEEINVIDMHTYTNLVNKEDQFDFWIFDERIVCKINYDRKGNFLGTEIIDKDNIKKYIDIFHNLEKNKNFNYKEIIKQINNSKIKINFNAKK